MILGFIQVLIQTFWKQLYGKLDKNVLVRTSVKRQRERFAHDLGDDKILARDNLAKANMRYQAWW